MQRLSYVGELGYEIYVEFDKAVEIYSLLINEVNISLIKMDIENYEYYVNQFHTINSFPSRTYLPKSYNDLSLKTLIKFLLNKFLKRK